MAARRGSKEKVFNDRNRKVFRKSISHTEVGFSIFFVVFTAAMGWWFLAQRDNFDPGERDISMEVLNEQSVKDNLYRPPLLRWIEPGTVQAATGAAPDLGIIPTGILVDGWQVPGRLEEFDNTNLYEKIDGQEVQYKSFGFQHLYFVGFEKPDATLEVSLELYDMSEFKNALGIFAAQKSEGAQIRKQGGSYYYLRPASGFGMTGKFYYKFVGNNDHPAVHDLVMNFVGAFEPTASTGETAPFGFGVLAGDLGIGLETVEYQREDVFQYDFAKDFWFGKFDANADMRVFLHQEVSEVAAAELFGKIVEEHKYDYTVESEAGNNVVLKHDFLKTFATLNQKGTLVYGVENAPDAATATSTLQRVQGVLLDEAKGLFTQAAAPLADAPAEEAEAAGTH